MVPSIAFFNNKQIKRKNSPLEIVDEDGDGAPDALGLHVAGDVPLMEVLRLALLVPDQVVQV